MPRLPDCRIVGKELIIRYTSHGDALVGYRMIRDAVDAAEAKAVAPKLPLQLRVGGKYRDSEGSVWTVDTIGGYAPYTICALGSNGRVCRFTPEGRYFARGQTIFDLIEEIAPPPTPCPTIHDCRAGQTERCTCCDKEG